jgi:ABC-2 type transport system permease protein
MSTVTSSTPTAAPSELRGDRRASSLLVATALAARSVVNVFRVPGAFVPTLVMPIFFLIAFSGSFSGLASGGIVPTDNMLNWVAPYAILQGAAFAGMSTAFAVARDLEGGFYDRLLLASSPRRVLLFGPVFAALARSFIPVAIVLVVAFIGGARFTDPGLGMVTLLIAALGAAAICSLWGLGIALRFKSQRSLGLVQVVIFSAMFLSSAQVPIERITGWVKPLARVNPVSNILRLARQGFLDGGVSWGDTYGGLIAIASLLVLLAWFSIRGLRKLVL